MTAAGAVLLAWYLGFGWLSRRFELDADLVGLELTGESGPLIDALEQVGGAHGRDKASWRHFSTAQRVAFLERAERDPAVGRRLRRGLRAWTVAGVALFLVAAMAQ